MNPIQVKHKIIKEKKPKEAPIPIPMISHNLDIIALDQYQIPYVLCHLLRFISISFFFFLMLETIRMCIIQEEIFKVLFPKSHKLICFKYFGERILLLILNFRSLFRFLNWSRLERMVAPLIESFSSDSESSLLTSLYVKLVAYKQQSI